MLTSILRYLIGYSFTLCLLYACNSTNHYPEGGYAYPDHVEAKDTNFYSYPLRNIFTKHDSFYSVDDYLVYRPFHEPNLSIAAQDIETFRLTYSLALGGCTIITLKNSEIIVKKGDPSILYQEDETRLSQTEQIHLHFLKRRFPVDTVGKSYFQKRYIDSMTRLYPQLLDPNYYRYLLEKIRLTIAKEFSYSTTIVKITNSQYDSLVSKINQSGYWKLPYEIKCDDPPMDGYGFTFEANTKLKYNLVIVNGCPGDRSKFLSACQQLVDLAKMGKHIHLNWN